ncbi:MAG: hypothetical protein RMK79_12490, partial [Anaerolineae bacterium]|nr:hypothetical protein [Anaerolineae bacterium]
TEGSTTAAIDTRGFSKCAVFVTVSGLQGNDKLTVALIPRLTQTGSNFSPNISVSNTIGNGNTVIVVDISIPYVMVSAQVSGSSTATVTCQVYLGR